MVRTIVSILIAALLITGGILLSKNFAASKDKKAEKKRTKLVIKGVYVDIVDNATIPIEIVSNGQLEAFRRVILTSEGTGVLRNSGFKEGVKYNKGQVIFSIDNEELNATVVSQRNAFYASLLRIMPDLKLDYPNAWSTWDSYLKSVNPQQNLPPLPSFSDERTKNFITVNGILATYQSVKNLEIRSDKFYLRAPFNGVITQANVREGSLVTMNQPLGEISSLGDYELVLPVNVEFLEYLQPGQSIRLSSIDGKDNFNGTIDRVNPSVDPNSQSIIAYVRVKHNDLREGMFLQATINAGSISNAVEIDRKLLNTDQKIFTLNPDTILALQQVKPIYFKDETVVVQGLENGTVFISKVLPGAYSGMKVKVLDSKISNL